MTWGETTATCFRKAFRLVFIRTTWFTVCAAVATTAWSTECVHIGSRRELFVDDYLVEPLQGGTIMLLHQPNPK